MASFENVEWNNLDKVHSSYLNEAHVDQPLKYLGKRSKNYSYDVNSGKKLTVLSWNSFSLAMFFNESFNVDNTKQQILTSSMCSYRKPFFF